MILLTAPQAVERLRHLQTEIGISGEAHLQFIEKRHIELSDSEEIEPVYPYPEGTAESDQCVETTPVNVPSFDGSDSAAIDNEIEHLARHLVWVGKFVYRSMFWELAIDQEGTLIRIKKAR